MIIYLSSDRGERMSYWRTGVFGFPNSKKVVVLLVSLFGWSMLTALAAFHRLHPDTTGTTSFRRVET